MIESFFVDDVDIITPVLTTDSRGATVSTWNNSTEVHTKGWMSQTDASSVDNELKSNRDGTNTTWRLFLDKQTILDNRCRIRYLGELYEVNGRPHMAKTPNGPHHLEVPLKLVEG